MPQGKKKKIKNNKQKKKEGKKKSHLQDFSEAGLPVVQVVEAIHGHVHHVNGTAVLRPPGRPIPADEEMVPVVVAHPPHQRRHHLKKRTNGEAMHILAIVNNNVIICGRGTGTRGSCAPTPSMEPQLEEEYHCKSWSYS